MPDPAAELIRLADLTHNTPAYLAEIRGGSHLTRRLMALGLRTGSRLRIVQRRGQGLVLASGEARIAIGSGIADKLWVSLDVSATDGDVQTAVSDADTPDHDTQNPTPAGVSQE